MLLKALLMTLAFFAGSVGVLRASVLAENYLLLVAGVALALGAVVFALRTSDGDRHPRAA